MGGKEGRWRREGKEREKEEKEEEGILSLTRESPNIISVSIYSLEETFA